MAESANPTELLASTEVAATETTATEAPTANESPKPEAAQDAVLENGKVAAPVAPEEEKEENLPSPAKPSSPKPLSPEHSSPKEVPATAPEQPPAEQTPAEEASVGLVNEPEVAADPLVVEAPAPATAGSEVANVNGDAEKENGETVVAEEKPQEKKDEDSIPPEGDSVVIPPHWHAKPCVHLTSIGGFVSEEFNMPSQASGQEDSINGEDRVISMTCSGLDKAIF